MKKPKFGLLPRIFLAIIAGLFLGSLLPVPVIRLFVTFNQLFANFLGFCIPLIILGLVAPGIADLGKSAGKLLVITVILAYCFTLFSGFFTFFSCYNIFPQLLENSTNPGGNIENPETNLLMPFFTVDIPPVFEVMTALVLAFTLGIGAAAGEANTLKSVLSEIKTIVERLISSIIIPLLPIHILGIFMNMSYSGSAFHIITVFGKVIGVIFILHIFLLILMYCIAGLVAKKNPFRLLINMLPAYMTALGTASSAATIPVTLAQTKKMGVNEDVADFCIPLCATIHLSGSVMKIVAMSLAICILYHIPWDLSLYSGFIFMLAIVMVAAPGVPGGAIMAATGVLQSILHFDNEAIGLMIALYIAIDSFGTACNVTGDGSIAIIVDKILNQDRVIKSTP